MSDFLFEEMIRANTRTHVCRIWRQLPQPGRKAWKLQFSSIEVKDKAMSLLEGLEVTDQISYPNELLIPIVQVLVAIDKVNSVEIINRFTGDGVCVHKDWP